jgi:hypothetical protein
VVLPFNISPELITKLAGAVSEVVVQTTDKMETNNVFKLLVGLWFFGLFFIPLFERNIQIILKDS